MQWTVSAGKLLRSESRRGAGAATDQYSVMQHEVMFIGNRTFRPTKGGDPVPVIHRMVFVNNGSYYLTLMGVFPREEAKAHLRDLYEAVPRHWRRFAGETDGATFRFGCCCTAKCFPEATSKGRFINGRQCEMSFLDSSLEFSMRLPQAQRRSKCELDHGACCERMAIGTPTIPSAEAGLANLKVKYVVFNRE